MTEPAQVFIGVDGGGTKTAIVTVDDMGQELARHVASTSNPAVIGFDQCVDVLTSGITIVATEIGAEFPLAGGWLGLSGFDRPGDRERIIPSLEGILNNPFLSNDGELVLAELPDKTGVAVIAGTGSIAIGRNASGEHARAGGWGHIFGDEGSGWALGKEALRSIAEEIDGRGAPTALTALVMEAWELDAPTQIVTRAYDPQTTKSDIAKLSSLTIRAGWVGDDIANHIITTQTQHLADQVIAVANRLGFREQIPLAMSGGLLLHVLSYRTALREAIERQRPLGTFALVLDPALSAAQAIAADSRKGQS